jgi:hypothetical protein
MIVTCVIAVAFAIIGLRRFLKSARPAVHARVGVARLYVRLVVHRESGQRDEFFFEFGIYK